ncbi:GNAT family N-acetyltransferase [Saccharomonospora azurea]|uniref:Acetyltransferase, ribosomal protein N-acetylase n=1 Tax=Saccharomonospora azurea NA-128 TaxID=882081 RepID=H8G768_9PSEU|nr:GNAT family N-acetyltransferase [Saccharomonospora azurea]EHY88307.1 acetyltransferase, ribosomal protein N-acetylase [Saccharomonospora azurea NA-128]
MNFHDVLPVRHDGVTLRPLADIDAEAYAEGTRDAAVRRYAHLPLPEYTPDTVRELARSDVRRGLDDGTLAVLSIVEDTHDTFLGSLVLFDIAEDQAEVGFWLAPHARGRGVAHRALAASAALARALGLSTLTARTDPTNTSSRRTLTAAGFAPDGPPRHSTTPSGTSMSTQYYRLPLR